MSKARAILVLVTSDGVISSRSMREIVWMFTPASTERSRNFKARLTLTVRRIFPQELPRMVNIEAMIARHSLTDVTDTQILCHTNDIES